MASKITIAKSTFDVLTVILLWLPTPGISQRVFLRHSIENPHGILSVRFSPDNKILVCGGERVLRVYDVKTGKLVQSLDVEDDFIESVAFSPDGKLIASASEGIIKMWNAQTWHKQNTLAVHHHIAEVPHSYRILSINFSPDGRTLASVSGAHESVDSPIYGEIRLWDVETGNLLFDLPPQNDFIWSVAFSPDGNTLATANHNKTVKIWDLRTRGLKAKLRGHRGAVYKLVFSLDGSKLITGSEDKAIRVWHTDDWKLTRDLKGHKGKVFSLDISPQGSIASAGGDDRTIRIWNVQTGTSLILNVDESFINTVAISSDGKYLACGSADGTVIMWEIK
jgi:WD40 repeat protein